MKQIGVQIEGMEGTFTLYQIAAMSKHHLSREVIYERWKRIGRQNPISKHNLELLLGSRQLNGYGSLTPQTTYDGKPTTVRDLATMFETSVNTIRKIIRKKGTVLKEGDIVIHRNCQKAQIESIAVKKNLKSSEVVVGSWEKEHLAHVGRNGY